jgi:O-antigen/teichoic acid export membrane protein
VATLHPEPSSVQESCGASLAPGSGHVSDPLMSSRTVSVNTAVLTLGQLLGRVTGLVFTPFIARHLGSAELASYNLSNVLVTYFSIIVLFGFSPLVVREMVTCPARAQELFGESLAARLWLATLSVPALLALLYLSQYPSEISEMTLILSVSLFTTAITDAADTVFQAHQKMVFSVVSTLSGSAVYLVLGSVALYLGGGVVGLSAANAAGMATKAIISLTLVGSRFFAPFLRWSWRNGSQLMWRAVPFFLGAASATILSNIDVAILSHMVPLKEVGFYIAGYFFLTLALYLPSAFAQAVYPVLSRTASEDSGSLQGTTQRFFRLMVITSVGTIVAVESCASLLIRTFYGSAFGRSERVLEIVIVSVLLVAYTNTVGRSIYAAGGQWPLVLINGGAAVSNIVLNIALIGRFGIIGASLATVVSFSAACGLHAVWSHRYRCAIKFGEFLWAVPATIVPIAIAHAVSQACEIAACPAALATYGFCLVALRVLNDAELALLQSHSKRLVQSIGRWSSSG